MTKTIYLMWHGETLFSRQGKCEGWSDSPLTDRGRAAARALGTDVLAAQGIEVGTCFSSSSGRAWETLELACEAAYGRPPRYELRKGLKDLSCGCYEAQDRCLAPAEPYGDFFVKFGGESADGVALRMRDTLLGLAGGCDGQALLVSSHRLACAVLCGLWDEGLARRVLETTDAALLALSLGSAGASLPPIGLFEAGGAA